MSAPKTPPSPPGTRGPHGGLGLTSQAGRAMFAGAEMAREEREDEGTPAPPPPSSKGSALKLRVAANLRRLRKAAGLTRSELGRRSGLGGMLVGNIEHAGVNITIGQLGRLAEGLGVEVSDLLQRPA